MRSTGGYLLPPFIWVNQKAGLQEDHRYQRWTKEQIRAMKNGTYAWPDHKEQRAGSGD